MSRPVFRQLLIHDGDATYRPLGLTVLRDSFGEPYVKVVLPSFRVSTSMKTRRVTSGGEIEVEEDGSVNLLDNGIVEYSYHYHAGVSHYKTTTDRILQKRNLSAFPNQGAIHLLRIRLFDLSGFEPYLKPPKTDDIQLNDAFNGTARAINPYLLRQPGQVEVHEVDPLLDMNHVYALSEFEDPDLGVLIVDSSYNQPTVSTGWDLFTYDDPSVPSRPPADTAPLVD